MKNLILTFFAVLAMVSCRKTANVVETNSGLKVAEKNMSVISKITSTGPCGGSGWTKFEHQKTTYKGKAVFMAFKRGLGITASNITNKVKDKFNISSGTPTFFRNFSEKGSDSKVVNDHFNAPVIVNSNYELTKSGDVLNIKTTTKFFQNTHGKYFITPYLLVNNIKAKQFGHPDTPNTLHQSVVSGVAVPKNTSEIKYFGYEIAGGRISEGYSVNLDFDMKINATYLESDLSLGLVIYKEQGDSLVFVNAFTK